jgi:hypothetical protein
MIRLALVFTLLTSAASAHDWYPLNCCSGTDCFELPPSAVEWTPWGWHFLESGEFIKEEHARQSPDQHFH